jgi:very-short-patch-repair endonuclease
MPRPKRTTPEIQHRAIQLSKEPTPAERKLWARLHNDQLGVIFRRHTVLADGARDTLSAITFLILSASKRN